MDFLAALVIPWRQVLALLVVELVVQATIVKADFYIYLSSYIYYDGTYNLPVKGPLYTTSLRK